MCTNCKDCSGCQSDDDFDYVKDPSKIETPPSPMSREDSRRLAAEESKATSCKKATSRKKCQTRVQDGWVNSLLTIVEKIVARHRNGISAMNGWSVTDVRFRYNGNFTICLLTVVSPDGEEDIFAGASKYKGGDTFNPRKGDMIALQRATLALIEAIREDEYDVTHVSMEEMLEGFSFYED
jgi:hypothetical protein